MAAPADEEITALAATHKLKLKPPTYDGNYATYEEWKYKFTAYMGLQDPFYPRMFRLAEAATQQVTEAHLRQAATTLEEAEAWVQLDQNLKYVLINVTTGAAATLCRQHQHEIGLEVLRQLNIRFSLPVGTRSIGYLTKLLKPTFDNNNFEESFSNWEFELNKYERDNNTQLPDQVKIAVLMNETKGPLQQHLHLMAGATPTYTDIRATIMEYYRTTTAFNRLQQQASSSVATNYNGGAAPMDIGAVNKGKGKGKNKSKGKKGKSKGKKGNKGKGYGQHSNGYGGQGKGKGPVGQQMYYKGSNNYAQGKDKGQGKATGKGRGYTTGCYRCGQQGHTAKDCRVPVYNIQEDTQEGYNDATDQWYGPQTTYDNHWWTNDQTQVHAVQQQSQQLALPAPAQLDATPALQIAAVTVPRNSNSTVRSPDMRMITNLNKDELMIDSGAATHVCPIWFASTTQTYDLPDHERPNLRTATEDPIEVYGYKWVYMTNESNQQIVIPFYVCSVSQPILSVTRLAEQGFTIHLSEHPTITHPNGFEAKLRTKEGTYFLPVNNTGTPPNYKLDVHETQQGIKATISPITLTPGGAQWVTHQHDIWTYNSQGYLVRLHKAKRRATYMPDQQCPVPMDKLEDYRRTIAHKHDGTTEDFEEKLHSLEHSQQKRMLNAAWKGETWFKVKQNARPPKPPITTPATTGKALPAHNQQQQESLQQKRRYTEKKPERPEEMATSSEQQPSRSQQSHSATSIPRPKEVSATEDYWIREGHLWKRVHIKPRTELYIPQQTQDGPDVTKLIPERTTMVRPTSGARWYRIDDDWTTKRQATLNVPWTGSTNFEESTSYKDEVHDVDEEDPQHAKPARGLTAPAQPTQQERAEHELTHLPFRSWCPTCVANKGRADNHPKQKSKMPVVQFDFCYFKTAGEPTASAILTGIDVETGMVMATMVGDKQQDFQYHVNCIQSFLMECGRVQAILNSTILQSDQEDHLIALLQTVASKMGGNITVRQSPTYTSQAQGSVERFHRTLMGQIRTLRAQLQQNYDRTITSKHPIVPWQVRHTAYLLNRYATHADGNTSYFRRWNKDHRAPICEFGETVQYLLPTVKQLPKMEQRFFKAIWLGRDTATGETLLGISNKVIRARTIRRMPKPEKYDKQMFDIISQTGQTMTPPPTSQAQLQPPMVFYPPRRQTTTTEKQTSTEQALMSPTQAGGPQLPPKAIADTPLATTTPALANSPMATAPTSCHSRPAMPSPPKRQVADDIAEGSATKQQRTSTQQEAPARPEPTPEQPKSRLRITKVTIQTKQGEEITAYSCEDATEQQTERILLEPIVNKTDGLDKMKTTEGMKQEILSMKQQQVYMEVDINTLTPEQRKNIIQSRWVLRDKGNKVRARIVAKGFTETIHDLDDIYASTPIFCVLRTLLTLASNNGWIGITGDISTAFLHAAAATADLYMYPPKEFYNPEDNIVWKLLKAIYGLRSSPKAWQKHLSEVLQQIGLHRSTAEPNIYMTTTRNCFVLVYVDDLLFLGEEQTVNKLFKAIQQQLLLRPTGTLSTGNTVAFLGRNITNRGDYYEISLADEYVTTLLKETNLQDSKPAPAPGTSALKTATADHDQPLSTEEHAQYRRAVGKLQWMTYTRPDISYATKELARALQQPTTADQQKLKHLLRYIKGTKDYKQIIRPAVKLPAKAIPDINVYVDSDWAGCPTTRKSTTGFIISLLGTTINYGSRTQATIALSSAEAELYAINTGATEALHIRSLLMELLNINKVNIKIHTDSSSGKSMATRIGSSRKAKHIELKHLFIQQLISHDYVRIIKIHTNDNPADILTKYVSTETLQRHLQQAGIGIQHLNIH